MLTAAWQRHIGVLQLISGSCAKQSQGVAISSRQLIKAVARALCSMFGRQDTLNSPHMGGIQTPAIKAHIDKLQSQPQSQRAMPVLKTAVKSQMQTLPMGSLMHFWMVN